MDTSTRNCKKLFLTCAAVLCTSVNYEIHAAESKLHFRSLSFAFACKASTPKDQEKYFPAAPGSLALGIAVSECVDSKRRISKVHPVSVGIRHNDVANIYEVVIYLNNFDALALKKITMNIPKSGPPDRMLIGVNDHIVIGGYFYNPFEGDVCYISAPSHDDAVSIARNFVQRVVKRPLMHEK